MLAKATGYEEFEIDIKESDALCEAGSNVLRHYNVKATQRAMDWITLCIVAGGIYGTRAVAIGKKARSTTPITPPRNVQPDNRSPPAPPQRPMMPSDFAPTLNDDPAGNA
jgi:hypothetical protein